MCSLVVAHFDLLEKRNTSAVDVIMLLCINLNHSIFKNCGSHTTPCYIPTITLYYRYRINYQSEKHKITCLGTAADCVVKLVRNTFHCAPYVAFNYEVAFNVGETGAHSSEGFPSKLSSVGTSFLHNTCSSLLGVVWYY